MQTTRQTARDAKELFRLCVIGGSLDEARVRQVVQLSDRSAVGPTGCASCHGFNVWCGSIARDTAPR